MGMQVQFSLAAEDKATVETDPEDSHYCTIYLSGVLGYIGAWTENGKDFWFDCGSAGLMQMDKIKKLIQGRICFNVS